MSLFIDAKYFLFKVKRYKVTIVSRTGKSIDTFTAKSMTQGPKNRIFKLENGLKVTVSNELACIVKQVWMYDDVVTED